MNAEFKRKVKKIRENMNAEVKAGSARAGDICTPEAVLKMLSANSMASITALRELLTAMESLE